MTQPRYRWTLVEMLWLIALGFGLVELLIGVYLAVCPYQQSHDLAVSILSPLLLLASGGGDVYIRMADPPDEVSYVQTPVGLWFYLKPRLIGWCKIGFGFILMMIAGVNISRMKEPAEPIDQTMPN